MPAYRLPDEIERIYGRIGFADRVVYSNFVSSMDGVVTLGDAPSAGSVISGRNPADRFLMGVLRACADAVLLGAGTLRATPGHRWTADHIFPDLASSFAQLRKTLGLTPDPRLVLVTASGQVPTDHPAVIAGATIVTTETGAQALEGRLPEASDVIKVSTDTIDLAGVVAGLRDRGYRAILSEGGPHLMGELIRGNVLDEAFVTISPVVAGRDGDRRLGMVAGVDLLPDRGVWSRLLTARRHGDFLFLRYGLKNL